MTFRDGDIFRWHYRPEREKQIRDPYWAKSCIGVVREGRLVDTYWHGNDSINWTPEEAARELELTYLGNFAELTKTPEHKADYYDESDCVNLNHPNSGKGNFYVRTGAKRSRTKMLKVATYKLERAKSELASAQRDIERFQGLIEGINAGADLDEVWL